MPVKNSKQISTKSETPVMEAKVEDKLVAEPTPEPEPEPEPTSNKGRKSAAKVTTTPNDGKKVVAKVTPETTTTVTVTPPTQKGGKKGKVTTSTEATTVDPTIETKTVTPQKGGKKVATTPTEDSQKSKKKVTTTPQKGGKKATAKTTKNVSEEDVEVEVEAEENSGRRIRSFKVQLPGKPDYEGRFTGLTPYQAANKALSKYFRETEQPEAEITFSICESTRKSKKSVYTYNGRRQKLNEPVEYEIKNSEGATKVIIKNFKNSLKKVKKSETATSSV